MLAAPRLELRLSVDHDSQDGSVSADDGDADDDESDDDDDGAGDWFQSGGPPFPQFQSFPEDPMLGLT